MDIANILGILGFILAVIVFVLTRWKRRKILSIDLECTNTEINDKFKREIEGSSESVLIVRVINTGSRPIAIDKNSIKAVGPKKSVEYHETDWLGPEKIPHPLSPNQSFEVGLFLETFKLFQGCEKISKGKLPISVELKDIDGKLYKPKNKYELFLEVDEVEKIK